MIVLVTEMKKNIFMWRYVTWDLILCLRGHYDSGSLVGGGGGLSWDGFSNPSGGMVGRQ